MTKGQQVLDFIKAAGDTGRSFSEIQRFIAQTVNGLDFDEIVIHVSPYTGKQIKRRRYRGYWCNRLLGGIYYGPGLLKTAGCTKNEKNRWIM